MSDAPTTKEWAEVIRADLNRAVEGIVSAGENLIRAKVAVAHGEWLPMLADIGISDSYARKLMTIGSNLALTNRSHGNDLPPTFRVLYELSRLDSEVIENGIANGDISPATTIRDAREYAHSRRTGPRPSSDVFLCPPLAGALKTMLHKSVVADLQLDEIGAVRKVLIRAEAALDKQERELLGADADLMQAAEYLNIVNISLANWPTRVLNDVARKHLARMLRRTLAELKHEQDEGVS